MTGTLARRSLRARLGRTIFIALSIVAGVSFVSGSFVLADSLKATFDNLFTSLNAEVDRRDKLATRTETQLAEAAVREAELQRRVESDGALALFSEAFSDWLGR